MIERGNRLSPEAGECSDTDELQYASFAVNGISIPTMSALDWFLILFLITALISAMRSPRVTGRLGEWRVARILARAARRTNGRLFTNLTLPAGDGTTQIDALLISPAGIYVVEVKTLKGSISGGPQKKRWRQQLGRRGHYFQNPIHQNHGHLKAVQNLLGIQRDLLKPLLVFAGRSRLTRKVSAMVMSPGQLAVFLSKEQPRVIESSEIDRLAADIARLRLPPGSATDRAHRNYVRRKISARTNRSDSPTR